MNTSEQPLLLIEWNEQQAYTFVKFSDIGKNCILDIYHRQNFCCPTPSILKLLIYEESYENTLNVCSNKNWIGSWGVCEIWEKTMLILLISAQKSYFCHNDAIFDVIVQEPVRKWRNNHRLEINRYSFAELPLFQTNSTICIFRQTDRANFAVRGPSSLRKDYSLNK